MKNFFQREKSNLNVNAYLHLLKQELNINNLDVVKKKKVLALYNPKFEKDFLAYRFDLLKKWMDQNKEYTKEYVIAWEKIIDKLYLFNELNSYEQQYIKNFNAVVFAKNRNLKQLIVDFSINKGEFVFYRYELDAFKLISKKGLVQIVKRPDMYITTQRLIISKDLDIISIYYDSIEKYDFIRYKLVVTLKNGKQCYFDSQNSRAVVESLKRVLARNKIIFK